MRNACSYKYVFLFSDHANGQVELFLTYLSQIFDACEVFLTHTRLVLRQERNNFSLPPERDIFEVIF